MTLAAFDVRSFRFQWPADLLTSWAFEMETLIPGWYVMVNTGSVVWLTTFASLQLLGTLAAPMFGALGDHVGSRSMLCAMRATHAALATLLMVLAGAGLLTPAWVLAVAALSGIVRPNDQVMRNALIGETIPPDHLIGALGMSRASMDSARVAGSLAGAALSTALGIGLAYVFVTAFYLASLALTFGVSRRRPVPDPGAIPRGAPGGVASGMSRPSRYGDLKDGLVYAATTPALLAPLLLAFLINLTAYPITGGLLPYAARRIYMVDATGLGWLVASFWAGALLASITMAVTGGVRHPERSMLVHTAIWYALLLAFGHVRSLGPGLVLLLLAGFVQSVAMISMMGTLLAAAGSHFRARVMGARMLAVNGLPLGLIGSGVLVERVGYPLTVTVLCAVGLAFTVVIGVRWRAGMWQRTSPRLEPLH
ncbi:MAG TPA: MFS transporter [Methylomirabilota bacterium]|nr:MFS transporter [Methylomirabilota bacterium]